MNRVPKTSIRVMSDVLKGLARMAFLKVGLSDRDAAQLSEALVAQDLRGVFSHGTRMTLSYVRQFKEGKLNPRAEPRVVQESPTWVRVDGDGGLGYAPSFMAVRAAVEKAKSSGTAVGMSYNHGHFGSAGHYTRVAVSAGCFGFSASSHLRPLTYRSSVLNAGGASPMSFGLPAGEQPPLVLDMATQSRVYEGTVEEVFQKIPGDFFKMVGLGLVCYPLGLILPGAVSMDERGGRNWEGADQGGFFIAVDVGQLMDLESYRRQMDDFIRWLRQMKPAPGYERADAPGGLEWERERLWATEGIPVGPDHQKTLEDVAEEVGIAIPW